MAIIFEDSAKVTKKQIPIPQNAKNVFKAMKKIYEPYLDKNIPGSKILKSLGSDKKYNKKGANANSNGKEIKQDSVNVNDAKVRLHRMNKLPKNSIQYQLNGGELAANLYRKGIERARGTKEVEAVKPPKPTTNADLKLADTKPETIKTPSGKITYTVTAENRMIRESYDDEEHPYYNYLEEYNEAYVFNEFLSNPNGKQSWGVLINPNMYAKALKEFTQYGRLVNFPPRYVYQWMGIIMKNTAILKANTNIAGHSQWFPTEDFEDFIISYFGNNREINMDYNDDKVKIEIFPKDVLKLSNDEFSTLNEAVDKYGQTYFPWVSQGDADRMVAQQDLERQKNKFSQMYGDIDEYIAEFNQNSRYKGEIEADYNTNKLYWVVDQMNFLDLIGFYDWMMMPDGSDAISDFGIEPLERILSEYDEELPPEKVLVIVNKALDVYHQRGDMASIFVTGGSRALSRIAEHTQRSKKKIYITEKQIVKLRHGKYVK